jgi:hypothetical protein
MFALYLCPRQFLIVKDILVSEPKSLQKIHVGEIVTAQSAISILQHDTIRDVNVTSLVKWAFTAVSVKTKNLLALRVHQAIVGATQCGAINCKTIRLGDLKAMSSSVK